MRAVSIVGIGQVPARKRHEQSLRKLGASVVRQAMKDAGVERVDALYAASMLADELQGQKHVAALIADEAGLYGIEALQVNAATAAGAAALRVAYLAVASGEANLAGGQFADCHDGRAESARPSHWRNSPLPNLRDRAAVDRPSRAKSDSRCAYRVVTERRRRGDDCFDPYF